MHRPTMAPRRTPSSCRQHPDDILSLSHLSLVMKSRTTATLPPFVNPRFLYASLFKTLSSVGSSTITPATSFAIGNGRNAGLYRPDLHIPSHRSSTHTEIAYRLIDVPHIRIDEVHTGPLHLHVGDEPRSFINYTRSQSTRLDEEFIRFRTRELQLEILDLIHASNLLDSNGLDSGRVARHRAYTSSSSRGCIRELASEMGESVECASVSGHVRLF